MTFHARDRQLHRDDRVDARCDGDGDGRDGRRGDPRGPDRGEPAVGTGGRPVGGADRRERCVHRIRDRGRGHARLRRARVRGGRHGDVVHGRRAPVEGRTLDVRSRRLRALPHAGARAATREGEGLQRDRLRRVAERERRRRRRPRLGQHPRGDHPTGRRVGRRVGAAHRGRGWPRARQRAGRERHRRQGPQGHRLGPLRIAPAPGRRLLLRHLHAGGSRGPGRRRAARRREGEARPRHG